MRFMEVTYHQQIGVVDWMKFGVPVTVILFIATYLFLAFVMFRDMGGEIPGGAQWVRRELKNLGKLSGGEIAVGSCFLIAAVLWFSGGTLRSIDVNGTRPFMWMSDAVIAMGMGAVTFLIPTDRKGTPAMTWDVASHAISWDVLLLFGGGLSLAAAIQSTGVAQLIGAQVTFFSGAPFPLLLLGVVTLVTFATGVISNTALAAMMMPLLAAVCQALGFARTGGVAWNRTCGVRSIYPTDFNATQCYRFWYWKVTHCGYVASRYSDQCAGYFCHLQCYPADGVKQRSVD